MIGGGGNGFERPFYRWPGQHPSPALPGPQTGRDGCCLKLGGVVMAAAGGTRAAVSAQAPAPRLDETRSFLNLIGDNQNTVGTKPPI